MFLRVKIYLNNQMIHLRIVFIQKYLPKFREKTEYRLSAELRSRNCLIICETFLLLMTDRKR